MSKKPKLSVVETKSKGQSDGRRQRSQRSREKILRAMWDLMLEGDMDPSAAAIAERAEVGLRSVFRHFEDLDTLYREFLLLCYDDVTPTFMKPFKSIHWKDQLFEMLDRNVAEWDRVRVPHTAGEVRRFKSAVLMDDYNRSRMLELSMVKGIVPKDIKNYDTILLAIDSALSFATMRRLREDRKLSLAKTKDTMRFMLQSIIDKVD